MTIAQFTTSTTGVAFSPGVVNGVLIVGSSSPFGSGQIRLVDGASTTSGTLRAHFHGAQNSVYVPLGGMLFETNVLVASTAAYGGISIYYQ